MRNLIIQFAGDNWDDEEEAEQIESDVQDALDEAGIDYKEVTVN